MHIKSWSLQLGWKWREIIHIQISIILLKRRGGSIGGVIGSLPIWLRGLNMPEQGPLFLPIFIGLRILFFDKIYWYIRFVTSTSAITCAVVSIAINRFIFASIVFHWTDHPFFHEGNTIIFSTRTTLVDLGNFSHNDWIGDICNTAPASSNFLCFRGKMCITQLQTILI